MRAEKLRAFLDDHQIQYATINHPQAFTAQEIAAVTHIPGKELAKSVIVKINGRMAMAVLPASHRVNTEKIRQAAGVKSARLASEAEFKDLFPDCELGAMPPFGNLYGMEVYADERLCDEEEIVFNAGCHTELLRMAFRDYENLVRPRFLRLAFQE